MPKRGPSQQPHVLILDNAVLARGGAVPEYSHHDMQDEMTQTKQFPHTFEENKCLSLTQPEKPSFS